jgi:NADH-quinone oxidoreductase subunit N
MAGFFGKLVIFNAAVEQGYVVLAVLGVISSVIAAYYYLKIIKVMFFDEAGDGFDKDMSFARRVVLFASIAFVLAFAVKPSLIMAGAQGAAAALFPG